MRFIFLILLFCQNILAGPVIPNSSVTTGKLANSAVTEIKIADDAVTSAKIAAGTIVSSDISASAAIPYTSLNLTGAITSSDLSSGAVTSAALGPANYQISSNSGAFTTTSNSLVDVTNLTITITTSGRPVVLLLTSGSNISGTISGIRAFGDSVMVFLRDGAEIGATFRLPNQYLDTFQQGSAYTFLDAPGAGTYTYKVQVKSAGSNSLNVYYMKFIAYEL